MFSRVVPLFLLASLLLGGCQPPPERVTIAAAGQTLTVEVARTEAQRERGLMERKNLGPRDGMIFVFDRDDHLTFWMKNTPRSLDIVFIRKDGTISTIAENTVPYSEDSLPSSEPVRAVLEINGGRSRELGIEAGSKVHAKIFGNGP